MIATAFLGTLAALAVLVALVYFGFALLMEVVYRVHMNRIEKTARYPLTEVHFTARR